jgi:prefoldin subunit 5
LWIALLNQRRLLAPSFGLSGAEVMAAEDVELRLSALERKIDDERRKTDAALEHLQQQIRQLKRELQTMNVRLANTAQRR